MKFPTFEEMAQEVAQRALDECEYEGKTLREWIEIIKAQPAISTDLISRQAAIDIIEDFPHGDVWNVESMEEMVDRIKQLPSAEEESFEWCTDCKEYDQEAHCCHRYSKMIRKTIEEIRGTTAIGEWVKVHGFVTPGGDPVWKCSNCGKGVHVYGIEHGTYGADIADNQWVACPNCGAIMIGERDG